MVDSGPARGLSVVGLYCRRCGQPRDKSPPLQNQVGHFAELCVRPATAARAAATASDERKWKQN